MKSLAVRLFLHVAEDIGAGRAADGAPSSALNAIFAEFEPRVVRVPAVGIEVDIA